MIRVAVDTSTDFFWGGSFQYAAAVIASLADLDRSKYTIHVWHNGTNWEDFLQRKSIVGHSKDRLKLPAHIQSLLRTMEADGEKNDAASAMQKKKLSELISLHAMRESIEYFAPHIVIFPQMVPGQFVDGACHIGVIHDLMHRYEPDFPEVSAEGQYEARERYFAGAVARCEKLLVDSATGAAQVLESYPNARAEQLAVVPFTASRELVRKEPLKPQQDVPEKFFFYPAQFWKHKNHVALARAVIRLKKELPNIHVVLTGTSDKNGYADFTALVKSADISQHFSYLGYVTDEEMVWLYRNAQALVMPTFFGPTNIPPLEAMALGCPVAVSGIYGMPESYGNAALYFDPKKVADIADVMRQLWNDDSLCSALRSRGLERAANYTFADFASKIRAVVEELASTIG